MSVRVSINYTPNAFSSFQGITLLSYNENRRQWVEDSAETVGCNVSNTQQVVDNKSFKGFRGFHLSKVDEETGATLVNTPLDGSHAFYGSRGYQGYCSKELSDSDGNLRKALLLTSEGQLSKVLRIVFDEVADVHPESFSIEVKLSGAMYSIDYDAYTSNFVYVDLEDLTNNRLSEVEEVLLYVFKLNKGNSNLKVAAASFSVEETYTFRQVKSVSCSHNTTEDAMKPSTGIIQQFADIDLRDTNQELSVMLVYGLLKESLDVKVSVLDDDGNEHLVNTYLTDKWKFDAASDKVTLSCKDLSSRLDAIPFPALPVQDRSLYDLLQALSGAGNGSFPISIPEELVDYCNNLLVPNSWMKDSSLLEAAEKVCVLGFIRLYWSGEAFTVMRGV